MKLRGDMGTGEQVILSTRSHLLALVPALLLILGAAVLASFASSVMPTSHLLGYLATGFALWLAVLSAARLLRWLGTAYILTNHRLVVQTGILRTTQTSIPLTTIEAVDVHSPQFAPAQQAHLTVYSLGRSYRLPRIPRGKTYSQYIYRAQQGYHYG